jgi:hypothetical protein
MYLFFLSYLEVKIMVTRQLFSPNAKELQEWFMQEKMSGISP